jgi:hypothetical protein
MARRLLRRSPAMPVGSASLDDANIQDDIDFSRRDLSNMPHSAKGVSHCESLEDTGPAAPIDGQPPASRSRS